MRTNNDDIDDEDDESSDSQVSTIHINRPPIKSSAHNWVKSASPSLDETELINQALYVIHSLRVVCS